ncbi:MAG TPA: hypothetical protein VFL47_06380, partial [Flavisolibacter sp.]|nr:hypothetical protein [Flavisolibacter sp.]
AMQAGIYLLITVLVTLFFYACGDCSRKIDCPGYKDDTLDGWFPYRNNQQLIFESSAGQRDTFILKNTETTAPYQATSGIMGPPLRCEARKVFRSVEPDTNQRSRFQVELIAGSDFRLVECSIHGNAFSVYNVQSDGRGQVNASGRVFTVKLYPDISLGNRTFHNVVEATGDTSTTKITGLYKFYYAQGEGLVSFSEYPSLQTWIKQ